MKGIKKILKKFFKNSYYDGLKAIYWKCYCELYKPERDLNTNEIILKELGIEINKIKKILKDSQIEYKRPTTSWHYHLFAGFCSNQSNLKILEIGTYKGAFTKFLGQNFPNANIYSIDLSINDYQFQNSYKRDGEAKLQAFLKERETNLKNLNNVKFKELNSFNLLDEFSNNFFDLIWVDGDHHYPQVAFDIFQSYKLIKNNGFICVDDIIMKKNLKKTEYGWNEGFQTLNHLEEKGLLRNNFILKRANGKSYKKYISISQKVINDIDFKK